MSWAAERRTFILIGIGLVAAAVLSIFAISVFHEVPSCTDGKENQDEEGIDCGGSCTLLCSAGLVPPKVSFVRTLTLANGRTDIIAYVENPNPGAVLQGAGYAVELYGPDRALIGTVPGMTDIPPAGIVPIFIPGVYQGPLAIVQAFLVFDPATFSWTRGTRNPDAPLVTDVVIRDTAMPRITGVVRNATTQTLRALPVVATVFGSEDRVIAASRTLVAELPGLGSANLVFTWSEPWNEVPTRVDVRAIPRVP